MTIFINIYLYLCVCVLGYVHMKYCIRDNCLRRPKEDVGLVVSPLTWVLGTQLEGSARKVSALNQKPFLSPQGEYFTIGYEDMFQRLCLDSSDYSIALAVSTPVLSCRAFAMMLLRYHPLPIPIGHQNPKVCFF